MAKFNRRAWLGVIGAICASTASLSHAAQLPCFDQAAMQSARIHDLQVMLMVNALKCRLRQPETLRAYGDLLDQRGRELDDHSRLVQLNLAAQYGEANGPVAYHSYETAIANYHSEVEPSQRQCQNVAALIDLALQADHDELATLSRLATNRAIDACLAPLAAATDTAINAKAEPMPAVAAEAGPIHVAASEPEPEMVDGIPTYRVPGTGPDTKPKPLEKAVLTEEASPLAAQKVAKADPAAGKLDEAIAALSAAVVALNAMRQQP